MSIELLERAARELTPFLDEIAFVGGATLVLWITDPAAAEPRPTKDVDLVAEVASRLAWHDFEARLRAHGLRPDMSSPVICRWRAGKGDELLLDVMSSDATILGFENRWQRPALDHVVTCSLPSGRSIRGSRRPTSWRRSWRLGRVAGGATTSAAMISRTSSGSLTGVLSL